MKRFIYTAILIFSISGLFAQESGVSLQFGQGTYNLADLKTYQDELITKMPLEVTGLSYFPMFSDLKIKLFKKTNTGIRYGITYGYSTTGAHANYTDYSGYMNLDQFLTAYQLGINGGYPLIQKPRFDILAYGNLNLAYVRNEVHRSLSTTTYYYELSQSLSAISSYSYDDIDLKMQAISMFTEVGLEVNYHFNNFSIGAEGGYLLDMGGKFSYSDDAINQTEAILIPQNDLKSQMSGFRFGVKLIFWIKAMPLFEE